MTKTKEELILEQTKTILDLIDQNLPSRDFKEKLDAIPKLKLQALKNALETTKATKKGSTSQNLPYLNSKTLEKGVGEVKREEAGHNPFYSSGTKDYGVSPGNKAKKSLKEGEIEREKHKNIWFAKQGATADTAIGDDDDYSSEGSNEYTDDEDNLYSFDQSNFLNRDRSYSLSSVNSSDDESSISSDDESYISSEDELDIFDRTTLPSESSERISPSTVDGDEESIDHYDGKGEDISEILGTNLSHLYLDSEKESPKIRILVENDQTSVVSKGLKGYKDYYEYKSELERDRRFGRKVEEPYISGFGKCFATSYLVADPDMNATNIGFLTEGKDKTFARIDFGKALSYQSIGTSNQFEDRLLNLTPRSYTEEMFQGIDFAGEIELISSKFDQSNTEEVIGFAMKNLREAYGNDFLNNPEIEAPLKRRMGFTPEEELTEESIKKRICHNMQNSCVELSNMAEQKMQEVFPSHPREALDAYKEAMVNGKIDYGKFVSRLEKRGVNFRDPEHFNEPMAKETSNPMLTALIEAKEATRDLGSLLQEKPHTTNFRIANAKKTRQL